MDLIGNCALTVPIVADYCAKMNAKGYMLLCCALNLFCCLLCLVCPSTFFVIVAKTFLEVCPGGNVFGLLAATLQYMKLIFV